jgi:transaldolase
MLRPWEIGPSRRERRLGLPPTHPTPPGKKLPHPARHAAAVFADSAAVEEIRLLRDKGIIQGVTTNPTLLKKAGADSWAAADRIMRELLALVAPHPVCLELTELEPRKMLEQAKRLAGLGENVVIKVAIGGYPAVEPKADAFTGLTVVHELWKQDIRTLATLIFNTSQAYWAAQAGATYICPFMGRLADHLYANDQPERPPGNALYYLEDHKVPSGGRDRVDNTAYVAGDGPRKEAGTRLIAEIVSVFVNYGIETQVLAASLRNAAQVMECLVAGADIVTVPAHILAGVAGHPLTDAGMKAFVADTKVFDR